MPDPYRESARRWAELVEIDYFTLFVKAWIPFNAWFQRHFEEERDRQILNALKTGVDNPLRGAVIRLLERDDEEAQTFKNYVAQLHTQLEARALTNKGRRLTFTDCYIGENSTVSIVKERGFQGAFFTLERGVGIATDPNNVNKRKRVVCQITSRNRQAFRCQQDHFDQNELLQLPAFIQLREEWQSELLGRYKRINPGLMLNLLDVANSRVPVGLAPAHRRQSEETPYNMIRVGAFYFCNNSDYIFSGLLEILYALRCLLFHGEIVPTQDHNLVYEPAYFILRRFLQCLV